MARPKALYPRGCVVCKSTRPRAEWKPHKARGMCDTHYRAWKRTLPMCKHDGCQGRLGLKPKDSRQGYCRKHDYLLLGEPHRTADAIEKTRNKFVAQIVGDAVNGCWVWAGRINGKGYPLINVGNHEWLAHRYSYGSFIGGHEPGLTLDHVCRNPLCVRPDHLMPMTLLSNTRKQHDGREWTRDEVASALRLVPEMSMELSLWAMLKGLPIGRSRPGEPFGFGLDGQSIKRYPGPLDYPSVVELARAGGMSSTP